MRRCLAAFAIDHCSAPLGTQKLDFRPFRLNSLLMGPEERAKRRRDVIRRLKAGESYAAVGKDLGVSRQAIFSMYKQYEKLGEAFFEERKRGRKQERDHLTEAEKKQVNSWLQGHTPADLGHDTDHWSLPAVKRAVHHLTGKRVNLEGAYGILHYGQTKAERDAESGVLHAQDALAVTRPSSQPAPENSDQAEAADEEDWDLPSLEEMQRLNEESWKSIPWETGPQGQGYGMRSGKHAKGKGSPVQKKKKKRKKR